MSIQPPRRRRPKQRSRADQINDEIAALRASLGSAASSQRYRDPRWFRLALFAAVSAGRLPRTGYCLNAIDRLRQVGFGELFDHPSVIRLPDGRRIVCGEPYVSISRFSRVKSLADELAGILDCQAWLSIRGWHAPGRTIRVIFAEPGVLTPTTTPKRQP